MKPLFYILKKTLKNTVKQLAKKPLALILYILIALSLLSVIITSIFLPSNITGRGSIEVYGIIVSGVLLIVMYFGINQGIKSGGSFFRQADVNLVFTAPVKEKKVLVYGFIKQLSTTLFTILFLSFQIPNIRNNFPVKSHGMPIILLGAFLLIFSMPVTGMLIYSVTSSSQKARSIVEKALNGLVLLVIAGYVLALVSTGSPIEAGAALLNSSIFNNMPFFGWFKAVFMAAVLSIDGSFYWNLSLIIAWLISMIYGIYRLKTDFYEDVLSATERREEMVKAKKEGTGSMASKNIKLRKARQVYKGGGARAIFYRHILEYKKMGYFFVDRNTFIIGAMGIASSFLFPGEDINAVLFFSIYMLFFFALQGKWVQELNKPFIYLIPDSPARKVFFAALPGAIKNFVDGIVLFSVVGYRLKSDILTIVLCAGVYVTFGLIYTYGDMLSRRLLGAVHSKNLKMFGKMFLVLFLIMPGLILFIVFNVALQGVPFIAYYSYLVLIFYNILAALVILLLSRGIFENLEV